MIEKTEAEGRRDEAMAALDTAEAAKEKAGERLLYSVLSHGTERDCELERIRRGEFIAAYALYEAASATFVQAVNEYEATPEGIASRARVDAFLARPAREAA